MACKKLTQTPSQRISSFLEHAIFIACCLLPLDLPCDVHLLSHQDFITLETALLLFVPLMIYVKVYLLSHKLGFIGFTKVQ